MVSWMRYLKWKKVKEQHSKVTAILVNQVFLRSNHCSYCIILEMPTKEPSLRYAELLQPCHFLQVSQADSIF